MPPRSRSSNLVPMRVAHPVPTTTELTNMLEVWRGRHGQTTRVSYDQNLTSFAKWLSAENHVRVDGPRDAVAWLLSQGKVGAETVVMRYLQHLLDRNLRSSTVRQHRSAIRSAVRMCEFLGLSPWRIEGVLPTGVERGTKRKTSGPTFEQFSSMVNAAAKQWQPKAARDVAILRLIYALRVRESEVCRLQMSDYHDGNVRLVMKGHREGCWVRIPRRARVALNEYLELRGALPTTDPLFASCDQSTRGTGNLTRFGLYQMVRDLAKRAGVPGAVSPHRLLHTASTDLSRSGHSTDELKRWGRWEKRETAEAYIDAQERTAELLAEENDERLGDVETKS